MASVVCEFDGTVLERTPEGLEPACPACQQDIDGHADHCHMCRWAGNLPEGRITLGDLL